MFVLSVWSIAIAVLGLALYVARRMRPSSFRLQARVWRMFSFSLEIDSSGTGQKAVSEMERHPGSLSPSESERSGSTNV
jgi:hypothetical protein